MMSEVTITVRSDKAHADISVPFYEGIGGNAMNKTRMSNAIDEAVRRVRKALDIEKAETRSPQYFDSDRNGGTP